MPRSVNNARVSRAIILASCCVVVAALYFAQDVLIPFALAMLLSFLMAPVVGRLERWKLGRVPSVLIAVSILFIFVVVLGYVVAQQVYDLANNIDSYKSNIIAKVEAVRPAKGGVIEKFKRTASEVQENLERPEAAATTQATQPVDKPAELIAEEIAARTGQPRVVTEESKEALADTSAPIWTKQNPLPVGVVQPAPSPLETLGHYLGLALGPLGTAGIVIVFTIFMLLQREDLRDRLIRLAGQGQLTLATEALDDASSRISRYLLAQAIVNGTYGAAISIGLYIIGATIGRNDPAGVYAFPSVVLWGLLCALLRFIPYIGPWIAAAFPLMLSLAVYQKFGVFLTTAGMFVVVELLSNNFMEPWLYGSSTGISAVAVLVSAVFWTWLWGPIGLLLATPLTVVLVVMGKYIPQLNFLDVMLGDKPVLAPPQRIYQRLIARDAEEAAEVCEEYLKEMTLEELYDGVLIPALALAEQDRERGLLDDDRHDFILTAMRDMIEELGDRERVEEARRAAAATEQIARGERAGAEDSGNGRADTVIASRGGDEARKRRTNLPRDCTVNVVCLPAHDEADEIVNLMLVQLLELRGYCAFSVSQTALAGEMIGEVEKKNADAVVVSALPPGAVAHARYLCKRVHARFPDIAMAVGLWMYRGDLKRAKERITCASAVALTVTLAEMQDQIDQLAQSAIVRATSA